MAAHLSAAGPDTTAPVACLKNRLRQRPVLGRLVRYGTVSVVTTALSLLVLCVLLTATPVAAGVANVVAQAAGIPVSYVLNRRWVWRRSEKSSTRRETLPFWAMSLTGLALSTLAATLVAQLAAGLPHLPRTVVVAGASLAAYGILWLAEFMVLERVIFARATGLPAASGESGGHAHGGTALTMPVTWTPAPGSGPTKGAVPEAKMAPPAAPAECPAGDPDDVRDDDAPSRPGARSRHCAY